MTLKPSQASRHQPFLHLVGDHRGRAHHRQPAIAAEPPGELAHRQVLALGQRDHPLAAALARVGLGDLGQRPVGIEFARVDAQARSTARRCRCRGAPGCRAARASPSPRRRVSPTTTNAPGRIFMWSGLRPSLRHAALHVGIEGAGAPRSPRAGEHHLGGLGGELAAGVGGAGLDDHRPALDRPGDVERPAHLQYLPLWFSTCSFAGSKIDAALDVADEGVVGPAVPQAGDDVDRTRGRGGSARHAPSARPCRNSARRRDWRWSPGSSRRGRR